LACGLLLSCLVIIGNGFPQDGAPIISDESLEENLGVSLEIAQEEENLEENLEVSMEIAQEEENLEEYMGVSLEIAQDEESSEETSDENTEKMKCRIRKYFFHGRYRNISRLGMAAFSGKPDKMTAFLEKGCDPNYSGTVFHSDGDMDGEDDLGEFTYNFSILHIIATEGHPDALDAIIELPELEVNALTSRNTTPIWEAAYWGQSDIIKALAGKGGDVNYPDSQNYSPLQTATYWGYYYTALTLVALGADMDHQGGHKNSTALMVASQWNYKEMVELFISQGADINIKDANGWTALKWATYYNYHRVAEILQQAGATEK